MTNELLPSTAMVTPVGQRGSRKPGRASVVLGVAAILVLAAAATTAVVLARNSGGSGDPLFVLPAPSENWQLTDGEIANPADDVPGTAERFIIDGRLYGVADGNGYIDLRSQTFYSDSPLSGADWAEGFELSDLRRIDDSIMLAAENLDGTWSVRSSPDDLLHVYDPEGSGSLDTTLVAAFTPGDEPARQTTSFEMTSAEGSTFTVETAISASPLFDVATFADRIEPVDINGVPGWVVTEQLDDGAETAVTWSPETDRVVTVRSAADSDAVVDVARLLQSVSADEWTAVFPDAD